MSPWDRALMVLEAPVGRGCRREARQRLRVILACDLETTFLKGWSVEQSDQQEFGGQITKSSRMPITPGCWVSGHTTHGAGSQLGVSLRN